MTERTDKTRNENKSRNKLGLIPASDQPLSNTSEIRDPGNKKKGGRQKIGITEITDKTRNENKPDKEEPRTRKREQG